MQLMAFYILKQVAEAMSQKFWAAHPNSEAKIDELDSMGGSLWSEIELA